jgi:hypothetical protein
MDFFKDFISPGELADATGKKLRWIQAIADELIQKGFAARIGKPLVCHKSAIEYIKNRPETRGGGTKKNGD